MVSEGRRKKNGHGWSFNGYFWSREKQNNDENVDEEEAEEEPEEEQDEEEDSGSSEEEGGAQDDEPWRPLRQEVGEDLKEPYMKEVQRFLERGKTQTYAENATFSSLLPVCRRKLRRIYLERLIWIHRIKLDRKVMKTL